MSAHIQITSHASRLVALMALTALFAGCSPQTDPNEEVEPRIQPVARFEMGASATAEAPAEAAATEEAGDTAEAAPTAASGQKDGATVYAQICKTCHDLGISGAPKLGDKEAWAPRIATGIETLHQSSLNGKNVMPPKGGNSSLSDEEVKSAVDYMVAASK